MQNTGPTKICPKCYPSLSSYAGASSASNSSHAGIPKEPSFSRKRKIPEHDRKVTFVTDFAEYGSSTSEVNMSGLGSKVLARVKGLHVILADLILAVP